MTRLTGRHNVSATARSKRKFCSLSCSWCFRVLLSSVIPSTLMVIWPYGAPAQTFVGLGLPESLRRTSPRQVCDHRMSQPCPAARRFGPPNVA
jgi:hypothetical protein